MLGNTRVGFVVYGVHKDGLTDPMGQPFVDDAIVSASKDSLRGAGLVLDEYPIVVASRQEARDCLKQYKGDDEVTSVILFSGTWVWAAHLVAAVRDFAASGKGIVLWTHPGSQGWRPVGGFVMHGALDEVGIAHRFVYGTTVDRIVSYCRASHLKNSLSMTTVGQFGGRGMGQTCGVADPAQWMRTFGIDIDSRDTLELVDAAKGLPDERVAEIRNRVQKSFTVPVPNDDVAERSIRLLAAIESRVKAESWDFYTIQSFPGIADRYSATCLAQSMMLEWGTPTSTLSDFNTLMSVIVLMRLSTDPVYYGDLQHMDSAAREVKIIGDGACPPSLAGSVGPAKFGDHGIPTEGEAGGLAVDLVCKPGPGVLARMGRVGGAFRMVLARCDVFEPSPTDIRGRREECGIPTWPHAFLTVDADMDRLLDNWDNEYGVLGYGEHLYTQVADFCELTGISLVAL